MRRGKYYNYLPSVKNRKQSSVSATLILIIINVLFFAVAYPLALNNADLWNILGVSSSLMQGKYLWSIVTSMFMHGSFAHLFVNMISLLFLGSFLERLIGKKKFIFIYIVGGLCGSIFHAFFSYLLGSNVPAVGASGAIFTIGGVLAVLTPRLPVFIMFIPIPVPLVFAIFLMFFLLSLMPNVANFGHLGGLVAGLIYGFWLKARNRKKVVYLQRFFS